VVGQAVDDDHAVARAVAFVAGRCIVFACTTLGFVDGFFNNVGGHLVFFGPLDQPAQGKVGLRVDATSLGGHVDLAAVLAVNLGFRGGRFGHGFFAVLVGSAHIRCL